jgi:hypothetical protein
MSILAHTTGEGKIKSINVQKNNIKPLNAAHLMQKQGKMHCILYVHKVIGNLG